jgi:DNA-binding winged helix-turn-helix (wHTH) protein
VYYRFGDYTLDTQRYELCRADQRVPLRPKVFHVLAYLLAQRDRVVSKDELMAQVWPGQCLSEETLSTCIAAVRLVVADSGQQQQVIQTRYGHGYRFVAAVELRNASPPNHVPLESLPPGGLVVSLAVDEATLPTPPAVSLELLHPPSQPSLIAEQ